MNWICLNGDFLPRNQPALFVDNRSYRYGDGLFETMKVNKGVISLSALHFARLFAGFSLLKFDIPETFTIEKIEGEILELSRKNEAIGLGRVRLSVFRGHGGLYDGNADLQYIIESTILDPSANTFNEEGFSIGVFPDARKSTDAFCNLKSANFLSYSMAANFAREQELDDCLVLNTSGFVADSTVANVFIVKKGVVLTPPLSEGCVAGVVRKFLLQQMNNQLGSIAEHGPNEQCLVENDLGKFSPIGIEEKPLSIADIESAEEVFLTNSIIGIRWVKQFRNCRYGNKCSREIFMKFIQTI